MIWKINLLFYVMVTSMIFEGLAAKRKTLYFYSYKVEFDSTYIEEHRLNLRNTSVDVILNVAQDYPFDPWIVTALFVKERKSANFRKLINYDVNVCNILGKEDANLITVWVQNFLKFGSLPKSCPIRKGNYSWYKLRPEKVNIPDVFPSAEYKIQVDTYFRNGKRRQYIDNLTIICELK